MLEQQALDAALFGVWLGKDGVDAEGGEITFGGMDPAHFSGEITWAPVMRKGYWVRVRPR